MGQVGRPRTDDGDDIRKLVEILGSEDTTFRKACRRVYDSVAARQENFEIFAARLYAKRDREIEPLLAAMIEHDPEAPTPSPAFKP